MSGLVAIVGPFQLLLQLEFMDSDVAYERLDYLERGLYCNFRCLLVEFVQFGFTKFVSGKVRGTHLLDSLIVYFGNLNVR